MRLQAVVALTLLAVCTCRAAQPVYQQQQAAGTAAGAAAGESFAAGSAAKTASQAQPQQAEVSYASSSKQDYAQCKDDGCPTPQAADAVSNAYLAHTNFVWHEMAAESAQRQPAPGVPRAGSEGLDNPHRSKPPPAGFDRGTPTQRRARARKLPAAAMQQQRSVAAAAAQQQQQPKVAVAAASSTGNDKLAVLLSSSSSSGNEAASSRPQAGSSQAKIAAAVGSAEPAPAAAATKVHTAAVTNPGFQLPTGHTESGRGFWGTYDTRWVPTDEALAVGPHPVAEDSVLVMHCVNTACELFAAAREGAREKTKVPTKIYLEAIMAKIGYPNEQIRPSDPQAFFDRAAGRYVIAWTSVYQRNYTTSADDYYAPLFTCVSESANALLSWTCWALDSAIEAQSYVPYCDGYPVSSYVADYPQASYSDQGLFISIGGFCEDGPEVVGFMSALFAFPKKVLYSNPPSDAPPEALAIHRATYLTGSSWFRSLPTRDQLRVYDPAYPNFNTFNSFVLPSRPQSLHDIAHPAFVMGKVDGGLYMSIAKLTKDSLDEMVSIQTAPQIYAAVLSKGADFSNQPGYPDGRAVIPQPTNASMNATYLSANDVGPYGRTYGATHYKGKVYVATSEFFGVRDSRTPSIYWAIIDPSDKLCKPSLVDWGVVASEQGLALAYPVIVARPEGGALLAYAYGGNTTVHINGVAFKAYAGMATTMVGCDEPSLIQIVKRGDTLITKRTTEVKRWGDYSAFDFCDDGGTVWLAVPVAHAASEEYGSWITSHPL